MVLYLYLKGINFREDLFSRGNFFKNYLIFAGLIFARTGIVNFSRGLNFASFARSGLFIENSKPED